MQRSSVGLNERHSVSTSGDKERFVTETLSQLLGRRFQCGRIGMLDAQELLDFILVWRCRAETGKSGKPKARINQHRNLGPGGITHECSNLGIRDAIVVVGNDHGISSSQCPGNISTQYFLKFGTEVWFVIIVDTDHLLTR